MFTNLNFIFNKSTLNIDKIELYGFMLGLISAGYNNASINELISDFFNEGETISKKDGLIFLKIYALIKENMETNTFVLKDEIIDTNNKLNVKNIINLIEYFLLGIGFTDKLKFDNANKEIKLGITDLIEFSQSSEQNLTDLELIEFASIINIIIYNCYNEFST